MSGFGVWGFFVLSLFVCLNLDLGLGFSPPSSLPLHQLSWFEQREMVTPTQDVTVKAVQVKTLS